MTSSHETKVLAIASHVAHGHVGNTMATFVMQSLGCEVSAINTVQYSNHLAYKQVKGRKTPAEEILDLYDGLKLSLLNDFQVLLSGYMPSAEAVEAVGKIGRDLRQEAILKPGSFFWVLDPVMGDNGRLYTPEEEVGAYRNLLRDADLILPNQFEAELLSDVKITDIQSLATAVASLHKSHGLPHVVITSLRLSKVSGRTLSSMEEVDYGGENVMSIVGSSATSHGEPRLWRIDVSAYPAFFSGTGDMFAALMVARLREATEEAGTSNQPSWRSPDDVAPEQTPLAKAAAKVLASMQAVLGKTFDYYQAMIPKIDAEAERAGIGENEVALQEVEKKKHLRRTKAAEVRIVKNVQDLITPPEVERFVPRRLDVE